jgi:spermidine synthase
VELNPQVIELVRGPFGDWAGHTYGAAEVRVHVVEARAFATASRVEADLIQISLLDAFGAAVAGVQTAAESYLYTVEALDVLLQRLAPGGILAVTRWLAVPPRGSLKLFATAVAALERAGVTNPGDRIALIRTWNTATMLVRNGSRASTSLTFQASRWKR